MAETTENNAPVSTDNVCKDSDISAKRRSTYSKLMWGPTLSSLSQLLGMFGGPMLGAGLLALIGFGGAAGAITTAAIVVTAIGAALSIAGVVTNFIGSRSQNDGWLDQTEMGALANARYLVKELKANNMCLTNEHPQNCRADGKEWSQVMRPQEHAEIANVVAVTANGNPGRGMV
jgi:hypothetical protein